MATTNYVATSVSNLDFKIATDTNYVRRTDTNFGIGNNNILGYFSSAIGTGNRLGGYSAAFGKGNNLFTGGDSQYAFGIGNKSSGGGNFIAGIGSGSAGMGAISIAIGTMSVSTNLGAFVWNWHPTDYTDVDPDQVFDLFPKYYSHGDGSFSINPLEGTKGFYIGETNFDGYVSLATNTVAEALKQFVTNSVVVGYSAWAFSGNTDPSAVYSITMSSSEGAYVFTLIDTVAVETIGSVTTNTLNPTVLYYSTTGITASRNKICRNQNGFAYNSDVHTLRKDIENMDTSYFRFNKITNVNQSVQYIVPTSGATTIEIEIPTTGITKDWVVYINTSDTLKLILPPANYWVSSEDVTNDITTATALYFSQVTDNTYSLGRKEFVPVTVQNTTILSMPRNARQRRTVLKNTPPTKNSPPPTER